MPISERMRRGLSTLLVAALAATPVGWTVAGREEGHCDRQPHQCTPAAALDCQCHVQPTAPDTARLPQLAPPSRSVPSLSSLVDMPVPRFAAASQPADITSRHVIVPIDLNVLNHTFLI
jgi:hypothetical protein